MDLRYLIPLLSLWLLGGCTGDFLDRAPLDSINTANYPVNDEELITVVNGAYQPLQWPKLYNLRIWTSDIMAGNSIVGAGGGSDGIETQDMANFVTATDNAGVLDLWRGPWPGILMANIVLDVAPTLDIDPAIRDRSLGEAHFLRAHYYFILVRYFGDVPLITEPGTSETDLMPVREDKMVVYNQIISDFEAASELLPPKSSYGPADLGRANRGAALGMLAKVHLTLGNWNEVVDLTAQIEALGYDLHADYADNFNPATENGIESLFEVQYASDGGYDFWGNENQASWASPFMGPRGAGFVAGGFGWNQPTQEFVNAYEPGDLRKDATVLYQGGPRFDGKDYQASFSRTGFNVRKFLVPLSEVASFDNSPLNFPVLRYADVLLMRAEALNELGRSAEAAVPLDRVRARAGLPALGAGLDQASFRVAVLHERRMELAFEGQRWFDLVRVNGGQYGLDFLRSIGKSNASEKHLLFPIPQLEIDRNPNLTQNAGY